MTNENRRMGHSQPDRTESVLAPGREPWVKANKIIGATEPLRGSAEQQHVTK